MIEKNKYCSDAMKKHFNTELVMSKKIAFEHSTKCWIYDNDVKVRNHCHTNGKYRGSTH